MTHAIIIQARMGSTRLPGKIMADVAGKSVLAHVVERCLATPGINGAVAVAMPHTAEHEPLAEKVAKMGALPVLVGGDENDVLTRYMNAVISLDRQYDLRVDPIVRVTADCPLIDPALIGYLIKNWGHCDYASNVNPRTYPKGLDCELFSRDMLQQAFTDARYGYDREHVTTWIRYHAKTHGSLSNHVDLSHMRWTVDYPADLKFVRAVHATGLIKGHGMQTVLHALDANPELYDINASVDFVEPMEPIRVGDILTCAKGHPMFKATREMFSGETIRSDSLEAINASQQPKPGLLVPQCLVCGAPMLQSGNVPYVKRAAETAQ